MAGSLAITSVSMAATQQGTSSTNNNQGLRLGPGRGTGMERNGMNRPGIKGGLAGSITAISGSTITVLGKDGKTYTVDAATATIMVDGTASTLSGLAANDQIMVKGTPNSTDSTKITAQMIAKGTPPVRPALTGFHYRIIGQITAISGTTVTVKDSAGATFTLNAAAADIIVNGAKSTIANLAVNDLIMAGGTAADGTTTQIAARQITKGTEKIDLSTIKEGRGKRQ